MDIDLEAIGELFDQLAQHTRTAIERDRKSKHYDPSIPAFVPVEASALLHIAEQGKALVELVRKLQAGAELPA